MLGVGEGLLDAVLHLHVEKRVVAAPHQLRLHELVIGGREGLRLRRTAEGHFAIPVGDGEGAQEGVAIATALGERERGGQRSGGRGERRIRRDENCKPTVLISLSFRALAEAGEARPRRD